MKLTDRQKQEFDTPELQEFLSRWLDFMHSSPCTSRRTVFPYFQPPDLNTAEERDILCGADRETAWRRLMWAFRRAARLHAFDPFFETRSCWFKAETAPGLILLKEWFLPENTPSPGLVCGGFRDAAPEDFDRIWYCTRALPAPPENPLGNLYLAPALAPPENLRDETQYHAVLHAPAAAPVLARLADLTRRELVLLAFPPCRRGCRPGDILRDELKRREAAEDGEKNI